MRKTPVLLALFSFFVAGHTRANVKLPAVFGSHMVLQQGMKLPVWGSAEPAERVIVTYGSAHEETTADQKGRWQVALPAVSTGTPAGTLVVTGKNTITLTDVLVGDVWLCSGQSNMEFGLKNASDGEEELAHAIDTQIRFFIVAHRFGLQPCDDVRGQWTVCSPPSAAAWSAVAYVFARQCRAATGQPIGIIESVYSGSNAQAWLDLAGLRAAPMDKFYLSDYQKTASAYPGGQTDVDNAQSNFAVADREWRAKTGQNEAYQTSLKTWNTAVQNAQAAGGAPPPAPSPPMPKPIAPAATTRTPTMIFNGMIAPLIPFGIKGVIWYQGEDNTGIPMAFDYRTVLQSLIGEWRSLWKQGDFPFIVAQLPNFSVPAKNPVEPSAWAVLRESQLQVLSLRATGLAVDIDLGGDQLHPPDKVDVGSRLALVARHVAYGEKLAYTGPIYRAMRIDGGTIRVSFQPDSIGGDLLIGAAPETNPLANTVSRKELQGFAIAGANRQWVRAEAKIDGDEIVVSSQEVSSPVAVRYAWAQNPVCNLYNQAALPASPFRTDNWPPFQ